MISYNINMQQEVSSLDLSLLRTLAIHAGVFVTNKMCRAQLEKDFLASGQGRKKLAQLVNERRAKDFVEDALAKRFNKLPYPTLDTTACYTDFDLKNQEQKNRNTVYCYNLLIIAIKNYIRNNGIHNLRWENKNGGSYSNGFQVGIVKLAA